MWGAPTDDPAAELVEIDGGLSDPYPVRPVRPLAQLAARIGLWTAVGFGCLGGLVGLVGPPPDEAEPAVDRSTDEALVPAPVAGVAELVVTEWLTATTTDDEVLEELFVEAPSRVGTTRGDLAVEKVTTVGGKRRTDSYWSVTVAADVVETVPAAGDGGAVAGGGDGGGGAAGEDDEAEGEPVASTWYIQVGIVGDVDGGLAALTTPAIMPSLPEVSTGWRPSTERAARPSEGDPLGTTVAGFLDALLAGGGDPSRYVAPGRIVSAAQPALFAELELVDMSVDQLADGETRVLARTLGTTPGGTGLHFSHEIRLVERDGRWEVVGFSGSPTLLVSPPEEAPAPAEDPAS